MKTKTLALMSLLLLAAGGVASADTIIPLTLDGQDSGWDAIVCGNTDIVVDAVGGDYVLIEIAKVFDTPPTGGLFTPNTILFRQRLDDASTVASIRIADEIIYNGTGAEWTDYHWQVVGCAAAFDRIDTDNSNFSTDPFTNQTWGPAQIGWDADHPATLDVDGGVVDDAGLFMPGMASGTLFIDVDLSECNSNFSLMQTPTPEPGTMMLLGLGGMLALLRRRRK